MQRCVFVFKETRNVEKNCDKFVRISTHLYEVVVLRRHGEHLRLTGESGTEDEKFARRWWHLVDERLDR